METPIYIPSGNLLRSYWKWSIYSWFSYYNWWFSIAMLNYQRVHKKLYMMDNYDCPEKILGNSDDDDDDDDDNNNNMLVPPTRTYFFSIPLTVSLQGQPSAIYKKKQEQEQKYTKKNKNHALESLLPSPSPKVGHPKLFLITRIKARLIQINPGQIWFIWPLRHHVSIKCILHKP